MPGTTSTALPSFSRDQHHKTDVAKWKGGSGGEQTFQNMLEQERSMEWEAAERA